MSSNRSCTASCLASSSCILSMTSVLLTLPVRCRGRGKSPRRLVADVAVGPVDEGAAEDAAVGRVEDEDEAVGRPEDEAPAPAPAADPTKPNDDDPSDMTNDAGDRDEVDDLAPRCCCRCCCGCWDCPAFPFPLSAAARRAGPRAAKSRPPVCCMRPAHIHWVGGSWWKSLM